MDSWTTLSKTLKKKGLTAPQIKTLKKQLGKLDTATLLKTPQNKLLSSMPGATKNEKQKILKLFLAAVKEAKKTSPGTPTTIQPTAPKKTFLFTLQLLDTDASNSPPLSNTSVEVTLKSSSTPLFQGRTNEKGAIHFSIQLDEKQRPQKAELRVLGLDNKNIFKQSITLNPKQTDIPVKVRGMTAYRKKRMGPINTWEKELKKTISKNLSNIFSTHKITTLADIRDKNNDLQKSLQKRFAGLDKKTRKILRNEFVELTAHAHLQLVSADHRFKQILIDQKFKDIFSIAARSQSTFLAKVKETQGNKFEKTKALEVYEKAYAYTELSKNSALAKKIGLANDYTLKKDAQEADKPCHCDCQSAVSPLAYLADLLDFTLREVSYKGDELKIGILDRHFHQALATLPTDCSTSEHAVSQVRLCVEVLRRKAAADRKNTDDVFFDYVRQSYDAALASLGTSAKELRLLTAAPEEEREREADTIGIKPGHLIDLNLLQQGKELSEKALEATFGLQAIGNRDTASTEKTKLLQWQLEKLAEHWQQEEHPLPVYDPDLPVIDPDMLHDAYFCHPLQNNAAYEYRKNRAGQLATELEKLNKDGNTERTVKQMLEQVWSANQLAEWDSITEKLGSEDKEEVTDSLRQLNELHLPVESFHFLQELRSQETAGWTLTEREQALDILLNVIKRRDLFPEWKKEEQNLANGIISFSPVFFCIPAQGEPASRPLRVTAEEQGNWISQLQQNSRVPIIDPDILHSMPNISLSKGQAELLRRERREQLAKIENKLNQLKENNKLDAGWLDERLGNHDLKEDSNPKKALLHGLGLEDIKGLQQAFNDEKLNIQPEQYGLRDRKSVV